MQPNLSFIREKPLCSYLRYLSIRKRASNNEFNKLKELHSVMDTKSFTTYFQPLVELDTGKKIGYEVFNRPPISQSFPSTENFYDFVGQSDLIYRVEEICRTLSLERYSSSIQDQQGREEMESSIFLNVHPKLLKNSVDTLMSTIQLFNKYQIPTSRVVFEISEKTSIEEYKEFEKVLSQYRLHGFRFALDDVGSGYNSLITLVYLKPEFIKLDKMLIQNIDQDLTKQQLVKMLTEFSTKSQTKLVAEGIERNEELVFLKEHGVHIGQGYAIGKPKQHLQ
ncbi:EAL domain-containing protein [Bacillus suaedae]|uniref:EAL domain-containing protein n=1 Tax=Halalkalibacter suaedae TaxID=2822140 RepID=A0A941ANF8_9BACI|nr:EAL domain-containing protein [Bacillus suaedae]MBP3951580.1 EAL domain-containing protein [Bacillus suaedae]